MPSAKTKALFLKHIYLVLCYVNGSCLVFLTLKEKYFISKDPQFQVVLAIIRVMGKDLDLLLLKDENLCSVINTSKRDIHLNTVVYLLMPLRHLNLYQICLSAVIKVWLFSRTSCRRKPVIVIFVSFNKLQCVIAYEILDVFRI